MAERTIFDYLNSIYLKKELTYDKKVAPSYLLTMWLSHDPSLLPLTGVANEFQFLLPDNLIYQYYYYKVPQGKRYIRWVKKDTLDKAKKDNLEKVRKESLLSKQEFSKYQSLFSKDELPKPTKQKKVPFFG